jgi:protoporphyrin/coproporphyrin ferrochelatase
LVNSRGTAVLLLAHGTADRVEDIPEYLRNVTGGRPVPQAVIDEVAHRYALIGRSPLRDITKKQRDGVAAELGLPVYIGMRNWTPYIGEVVETMKADGVARAVAICMAPQNSRTSVGLYRKAVFDHAGAAFDIDFIESWHDHPLLIKAFAERLAAGLKHASTAAGAQVPVIFTAHSVPTRTITEGDPYEQQARETAALIASQASLASRDWAFAFQSQGMSGGPWLGPKVEDTILELKATGHQGVFIHPIGFLCDHVEVLYDIDIAFKKFAEENGMRLWRAESLNDSPLLSKAIADLARARLAVVAQKKSAD